MSGLLLFAALCLLAATGSASRSARASFAFTMAGTLAVLVAALAVLFGQNEWEWTSNFVLGGERVHMRLDGLSALFLAIVSVIGGAGAAYARDYWPDSEYPASAARGRVWWNALLLCMGLVLMISNGLLFLIAWEAFALCGFFLITLDNRRPEVRKAGWLYLAASHAGTLSLFAFFAMLAAHTGSWDLGPVRDVPPALFWLALFGFGMKAGFFPCHIWLPSAHANAPSHVSAIMSGVAIKMGIYGIVRFGGWLPLPASAGYVVIGLGAMSAVMGIAFAMAQNDIKRLLAYCSVENIGIIMIGLGAALLARAHGNAAWGQLALAGALLHVWNHGLFKSLLFFGAGSVLHATGTREMSRLGGLWRPMPWTAGFFALGAVAVSGLPPLNGFVSEWLIYLGLFDAATTRSGYAWAVLPAAILFAIAGALALAAFLKAGGTVFLGASRTKAAAHACECGAGMLAPMGLLAAVCMLIGIAPSLVLPAIARATGSWNPAWSSAGGAPVSTIGPALLALAALVAAAGFLLWKKAGANGLRRDLTWDCGYREPTARMQYTSGSFAGISLGWFRWIFHTDFKFRRPRGPFPPGSLRIERFPDTVLEWIVVPAGAVITRLSNAALGLQHGRLQAYILYLVAGLATLGVFVFLEGKL